MKNEVKNEQIEASVEVASGCQVKLKVHLLPSECKKAKEEALKDVRKQVNLPGFRKGKVPTELVLKHYGDAVDEKWREIVVHRALQLGCNGCAIFPWNMDSLKQPQIETFSMDGSRFTFDFEADPTVPAVEKEKVERPALEVKEVDESAIEERIEGYRTYHATFEEWKDRAIEESDWVRVDIESLDEDPPRKLIDNRRAQVKKGQMPPWIVKLLIGKKQGDAPEAVSELDPDADEATKEAFLPTTCRITVLAVEKMSPPEDDKLAKALGVNSMEELREKTKEALAKDFERDAKHKQVESLWAGLLSKNPFEVPASLLDAEKKRIIQGIVASMKQKTDDKEIIEREKEIEQSAESEALANLQRFFLARRICNDTDRVPTDEEIKALANQMVIYDQYASGMKSEPSGSDWKQYRNQSYYQLMLTKAEQFLLQD